MTNPLSTTSVSNTSTPSSQSKATPRTYILKSSPHVSSSTPSKYTSLYLRYTGSGHSSVVLTPSRPVFLRFHLSERGQQLASNEEKWPERVWGFCISSSLSSPSGRDNKDASTDAAGKGLDTDDADADANVGKVEETRGPALMESVPVEMWEGKGDTGFYFERMEGGDGEEVLKWKGGKGERNGPWKGWLVVDSPAEMFQGFPRVFYGDEDVVEGQEMGRVNLVREFL